jgi:hypothetical protein
MALVLKDRVKETTTTTGTGSFSLAGAVTGYDSFGQIGSGNTTYYAVYLDGGSEWEVGIGTYTSPSTLSRDTILASSNSGSVVTFSAGQKTIWCDYPAGAAVYASNNGSQTSGQVLKSNGVGTPPTWQTTTSGDVVGPASATDNAVARFDTTTGKLLQNSVVAVGDTGAVSGVTTLSASTSVTTPIVQATNSAGLALRNSAGTTQISMGGGGGDNVTIAVATNINGANAQIDISPTGTGHVHIKPTGTGSLEIAPTNVGTMDNMTIGATTARNASVVDLSVTGTLSFDAAQGTAGQVLTSAGTGSTPTWTTPTTGTVTSVTGTAPVVSSGGTTPAISMAQSSTTVDGYLSATDFTTFNSKLTNPMSALGDIIYGASSGTATRLAGNTTTNKYFLSQTGTGSASAVPSWSTLPTVLPVLNRAGSTVSVAVGNGVLPVLNRAGSTVNVAIN